MLAADGSTAFAPEADRYHLYVQLLCPFAQRANIMRSLKGLQNVISLDNLDWEKDQSGNGWRFNGEVSDRPHYRGQGLMSQLATEGSEVSVTARYRGQ